MEEPAYTCSSIDAALKTLSEYIDMIPDYADDSSALSKLLREMNNDVGYHIETLRDANDELRRWGRYWKDYAEDTEIELEDTLEKILANNRRK